MTFDDYTKPSEQDSAFPIAAVIGAVLGAVIVLLIGFLAVIM